MSRTLIHERVELARSGENPKVLRKVPSGWAVLGDVQFLRGYCLLLPDPVVPDLNSLEGTARELFLRDMGILGDAILAVTGAVRINYEMLGNTETALHAHLFPRYEDEPEHLKTRPVWFYDWESAPKFDRDRDLALMEALREEIGRRS